MIQLLFVTLLWGCQLDQSIGDVEKYLPDPQAAALARAACKGDVKQVRAIVAREGNADWQSDDGVTPLMWAVSCGSMRGVETLVELGADVNRTGYKGISPATRAAWVENPEILKFLVRNGADLKGDSRSRESSVLFQAAQFGLETDNWENYDFVLTQDVDLNAMYESITIADKMVGYGRFSRLIELVEKGFDHDLPGLREMVETRVASPESELDKEKLLKMLDALIAQNP